MLYCFHINYHISNNFRLVATFIATKSVLSQSFALQTFYLTSWQYSLPTHANQWEAERKEKITLFLTDGSLMQLRNSLITRKIRNWRQDRSDVFIYNVIVIFSWISHSPDSDFRDTCVAYMALFTVTRNNNNIIIIFLR